MLSHLRSTDAVINNASERISTGKKVNSAKDDALAFSRITTTKTSISSAGIALSTLDYGMSRLDSRDQTLSSMQEGLMRFKELATLSAGGIYNLKDIQPEMASLEQAMVSLGNTQDASGLMFSGDSSATPFVQDPTTKAVTYAGSATAQVINVEGITISGTVSGTPLIQTFNAMRAVLNSVAAGTKPTIAQVDALGTALDTVVGLRTAGAAEGAAAQNIQQSITSRRDGETNEMSRLESADITEETIKLQDGNKQYEAMLKITGMDLSRRRLMDFI